MTPMRNPWYRFSVNIGAMFVPMNTAGLPGFARALWVPCFCTYPGWILRSALETARALVFEIVRDYI